MRPRGQASSRCAERPLSSKVGWELPTNPRDFELQSYTAQKGWILHNHLPCYLRIWPRWQQIHIDANGDDLAN